jgi:hypothetical protein
LNAPLSIVHLTHTEDHSHDHDNAAGEGRRHNAGQHEAKSEQPSHVAPGAVRTDSTQVSTRFATSPFRKKRRRFISRAACTCRAN